MKRFVVVAIIAAAAGTYGPRLLESLIEDRAAAERADDSSLAEAEPTESGVTDGDNGEHEQLLDDMRRAKLREMEDAIERLEDAERDCYRAARRPGGTGGNCKSYTDQIRAAQERLRQARRR